MIETTPEMQTETPGQSGVVITVKYIEQFRRRARLHYIFGACALIFITVLAGAGSYIFRYAQEIDKSKGSLELISEVQLEKKSQEAIVKADDDELQGIKRLSEIGAATSEDLLRSIEGLGMAKTKLAVISEKERLMQEVGYFADLDSIKSQEELRVQRDQLTDIQKQFETTLVEIRERNKEGKLSNIDVLQAEKYLAEATGRAALSTQKLKSAQRARDISSEAETIDVLNLIKTSLIRFGGVAIVLYLISIIVPLYKYNIRIAAYYLARADTLDLFRESRMTDFNAVVSFLTPTHEFDREPATPIDSLASLLKATADVAKRA